MSRYINDKTLINSSEYYEPLRKERGVKQIKQYATVIMHQPTVAQRAALLTAPHIWTYGDRFYKLASQYYGDARLWWVIAWYNGRPTEVDIHPGQTIRIPLNITNAFAALGY